MWRAGLQALKRWRHARAARQYAVPDGLWLQMLHGHPFLLRLSLADRLRLRAMVSQFLACKEFTGVNGLTVTDEMAVTIAAQACLPVLNLGLSCYDGFVGIVVQPDEVLAHRIEMDEDGVVHEYDESLTGEAMAGGPVMLAWADVANAADGAAEGYNVIIHEFAHVLDMQDGEADGVPVLPSHLPRAQWIRVLHEAWQTFCDRLDAGLPVTLDDYGATGPEEFFAVSTEAFFVAPELLHQSHPSLYQQFVEYYQQQPLAPPASA